MSSKFVTINKEVDGRFRIVDRPDSDHSGSQHPSSQAKGSLKKFVRGNSYKEDPVNVASAWRELCVKPCSFQDDDQLLAELDRTLNIAPATRRF